MFSTYVHADLHGASSTIIKNNDPTRPIPPLTINQAGCFTVCRSQAWDSKIVTSAWWVHPHQVSKAAPTGEYLTVGSFMVRGKKNFLPPNPLVMGYGLLFRLDESCIAAHLHERRFRGDVEEDESVRAPSTEAGHVEMGKLEDTNIDDEDDESEAASEDEDQEVGDENQKTSNQRVEEKTQAGPDLSDLILQMEGELTAVVDDRNTNEGGDGSALDDLLDKALELRSAPKVFTTIGSNKYGLEPVSATRDAEGFSDSADEGVKRSKGVQREKPYISKAERRKLKKGIRQAGDEQANDVTGDEEHSYASEGIEGQERLDNLNVSEESSAVGSGERGLGLNSAGSKPSRGRKGKLKKIKEKYSEQDEEERQLRMSLLASAGRKDTKQTKVSGGSGKPSVNLKTASAERKGIALLAENSAGDPNRCDAGLIVCYKCKMTGHIVRDCPLEAANSSGKGQQPTSVGDSEAIASETVEELKTDALVKEDIQESIAPKEGDKPRGGLSRRAYAKAVKEEIAAIMAEEIVVELGDDEKEKLVELDSLTGIPHSDDVLLYAVPMCGPYSALQAFKYRVKLTPGPAKKGKAAKVAIDVFGHLPDVTAREKELMKAVTDPELVACMLGNAKVTAPGLTKLKKTQKKSKKVAAKAED